MQNESRGVLERGTSSGDPDCHIVRKLANHGSLEPATVEIFIPWQLASTTNWSFFVHPESW